MGAIDAIADIACCAAAPDARIGRWYCFAAMSGAGFVNASGTLSRTGPAMAELLENLPTYSAHVQMDWSRRPARPCSGPNCRFDATPVMRTQAIGHERGRASGSASPTSYA